MKRTGSFSEVGTSMAVAELSSIANPIDANSHNMDYEEKKRKREKTRNRIVRR
jgi:hypothetical protein